MFSEHDITEELDIKGGDQVFTEKDLEESCHQLTRVMRRIFVDNKITKQHLAECYRRYATNDLGELPSKISSGKGNLISAITRDDVTYRKFEEVMRILGFKTDLVIKISRGTRTTIYDHDELFK